MKKTKMYLTPLIDVISIEVEQVLAASTTEAGSGWANPDNVDDDYTGEF